MKNEKQKSIAIDAIEFIHNCMDENFVKNHTHKALYYCGASMEEFPNAVETDAISIDGDDIIFVDIIVDNGIAMSADHQFIFFFDKAEVADKSVLSQTKDYAESYYEDNKEYIEYVDNPNSFPTFSEEKQVQILALFVLNYSDWEVYPNPFFKG